MAVADASGEASDWFVFGSEAKSRQPVQPN